MADGGVVDGPSHEQGGVDVQDQSGEPVAEVEGGERIFSTEDTAMIEQTAMQILQLKEQNPQAADQMATELGYAIVEMVVKQEQAQQQQQGAPESGGGGGADQMAQAANSFA